MIVTVGILPSSTFTQIVLSLTSNVKCQAVDVWTTWYQPMKPTTPLDTEMVFLRDVEDRLKAIQNAAICGRTNLPGVLGLQSVLNNRIAEVTKLRDEEAANAKIPK